MFRITADPSSGSLVQCLVKNCKNDSIVYPLTCQNDSIMSVDMSTDTIESFVQFLAKHCTRLSDDGSAVIRNMVEHF